MKDTIINLRAHHDANGDKWLEACFTNIPCGCKIVGNGLLSAPLNIKFCAKHAALAAPEPQTDEDDMMQTYQNVKEQHRIFIERNQAPQD